MVTYPLDPPVTLAAGWHTTVLEHDKPPAIYSIVVDPSDGTVTLLRNGVASDDEIRVGAYSNVNDKPGKLLVDCGLVTAPVTLPALAAAIADNPGAWIAAAVAGEGPTWLVTRSTG